MSNIVGGDVHFTIVTPDTILQENNSGLEWFHNGNLRNAIACFKDALKMDHAFLVQARQTIERNAEFHEEAPYPSARACLFDALSLDKLMSSEFVTRPAAQKANSSMSLVKARYWFMYNRPICNPTTTMEESLIHHPELGHLMSAILTFNLALAHHRLGWEESNAIALQRAAKLYKCAVDVVLLRTTTPATATTGSVAAPADSMVGTHECLAWGPCTSFFLACANNMGLVLNCLNQEVASRESFQRLMGMHLFLVEQRHHEGASPRNTKSPDCDQAITDGYIWNFSQALFQDSSNSVPPAA